MMDTLALTVLVSMVSVSMVSAASDGAEYKLLRREANGLTLESRAVSDTSFPEFRVRVHADATPQQLADLVWTFHPEGVEGRLVEQRQVLEESASERVVWQVVRPPVVSRRESIVRMHRRSSADGVELKFESDAREGPRRVDAVRVALIRGYWRFTADPHGGSFIEHVVLSDPGGGIPAWLAGGGQQDLAVAMVRELLVLSRP